MTQFTPVSALIGGLLIGAAAVLLMLFQGRIAGISGIVAGLLRPQAGETAWRAAFVAGLVLAPIAYQAVTRLSVPSEIAASPITVLVAGLLVGFGTRLGSGCTSGHGVCGIARLSPRSIVATLVFMLAGVATVYLVRHGLGY